MKTLKDGLDDIYKAAENGSLTDAVIQFSIEDLNKDDTAPQETSVFLWSKIQDMEHFIGYIARLQHKLLTELEKETYSIE